MIHTIVNVIYVLVAIAMIAIILLQRGAGAQAGSGFGAGASGTVFGARGSANFLSRSTAVLATVFFVMSLAMAWNAGREAHKAPEQNDLGVMSDLPATPAEKAPATGLPSLPAAPAPQQAAPAAQPVIPAAPTSAPAAPAPKPEPTPAGGSQGG